MNQNQCSANIQAGTKNMSIFYNLYWEKRRGKYLEDFSFKWPVLKKILPSKDSQKFLDFGCGTGKLIREMNLLHPKNKYLGIDVSESAIKVAKKSTPWASFYVVQDGNKFPFKNASFDFILAADVIEHVYNTKETFSELVRVLKKGGQILITTPYYGFLKNLLIISFGFDQVFDPMGGHIRFYTKKSLFSTLKAEGFNIVKYGYYGRFYPISRAIYVLAKK